MKSWIAYALAIVPLCLPGSALPQPPPSPSPSPPPTPSPAREISSTASRHRQQSVLLGGSSLLLGVGAGGLAGVAMRRRRINELRREIEQDTTQLQYHADNDARNAAEIERLREELIVIKQQVEPPDILIASARGEPSTKWDVPLAIARDAVWMECIYGYTEVLPGSEAVHVNAWKLADAIADCGRHHGHSINQAWFADMHKDGVALIARSRRRATAWAEGYGDGDAVRAAAPSPRGHFGRSDLQFATGAHPSPPRLAVARLPPWATRWETGAQHLAARLAATARHLRPAAVESSRRWREEVPFLKREAATAGGY
ncbi:MAG: hypothetical protein M1826_002453 [Phylliscum demangeonii]|nr:MAG: hypothetical protein M1826_002453 [Phylliscum demangeonii]